MTRIRAESIDVMQFRERDNPPTRAQKLEVLRATAISTLNALATSDMFIAIAGENLSGDRAVYVADDGLAYHADKGSATCRRTIGVTTGAASIGFPATIQTEGIMTEPTWAWAGNGVVWLANTGQLTQTPPTSGYLVQVGVPVGPTRLLIEPQYVAQLA